MMRGESETAHAEEALRLSEQKYRSLFEFANDGIILAGPEVMTDCNRRTLKLLERSREQLVGKTPWDISPPTQPDGESSEVKARALMRQALDGTPKVFEWVHTRGDGSPITVEVSLSRIEIGDEPTILCFLRDVTERRRTEEALKYSEEKFFKAFHASPDAITINSLADNRFIDINEGFEQLFGYSRDEVIGKTSTELNIWDAQEDRQQLAEALEKRGAAKGLVVRVRTGSGDLRVCELSASLIDIGGEPGFLAVGRDVSERIRVEREKDAAFAEIARLKEELERERDYLREEVNASMHLHDVIGASVTIKRVLAQVQAVASTPATVLILGESGTGKERMARAIHEHSPRREKPLVKVNCASIPRELFESEFFGHVKGAFTGAHRDRVGRFDLANGGTLFLDEVAEIPLELQGKLLRVLQEGEFERIGEERTRSVEVRIIAATNRDLTREIEQGRFRKDLYYRLSVFPIEVPPLRERREDIIPLANHFLALACKDFDRDLLALSRAQADALEAYDWPGNVRELRNVIERAVILSRGNLRFDPPVLPVDATHHPTSRPPAEANAPRILTKEELREQERRNVVTALERAGWKVSGAGGAAELLGVKPTTLSYRIKALGISKPS